MKARHLAGITAIFINSLVGSGALASSSEKPSEDQIRFLRVSTPVTQVGINLTAPSYFMQQQSFANLAIGDNWRIVGFSKSWQDLPREYVTPDGGLTGLPAGSNAVRMLSPPVRSLTNHEVSSAGVEVVCAWQGGGQMTVRGGMVDLHTGANRLTFHWADWHKPVWLQVQSVEPQRPISHIDCREAGVSVTSLFDPAFVRDLSGYRVLRFMVWQRTNNNEAISWQNRTPVSSIDFNRGNGVPIEDMVELAKETGAAPWFCMPWNADSDYLARFARYVHDNLPEKQSVYVEVGNEIWNAQFAASKQATAEGLADRLAANPRQANIFRLAQRTVEIMKVWEKVFADRPKRLVRVIATQQVNVDAAAQILGYRDTADHVDALATAPYFGLDLMNEGQTSDLSEIFRRLDNRIDGAIDLAVANRAVAAKYGKRYVAYEAGQHVLMPYNVPLFTQIEHDPRMYTAYKHYLSSWRRRVGDTMELFQTVGPIGPGGAWGIAEYSGQPVADAPKLRAVLEDRNQLLQNLKDGG